MPSTITIRDPFQEMRSLMRRTFDDTLPGWFDDLPSAGRRAARAQAIPLDVYETENGLAVEASLPGFAREDVEVTLEKGTLSIRAERRVAREDGQSDEEGQPNEESRRYFVRERRQGTSSRSILIGDGYDPDSIVGSLKNGVLSITVRAAVAAQPTRVAIREG